MAKPKKELRLKVELLENMHAGIRLVRIPGADGPIDVEIYDENFTAQRPAKRSRNRIKN